MPRIARVVVPGMPHHITQRGSRRLEIFRDEADRLDYLKLFREACADSFLRVVAYCLMTNHVHYVAIPERADSIWRVFHRVQGTHAQRFNIKYGFVGHLWQDRPYSCVLEESHFRNAVRYVEQNPVRAGMVDRAANYRWSSAAAHCRGEEDPLLDLSAIQTLGIADWSKWINDEIDPSTCQMIRNCTSTGRPCGDDDFIRQIEQWADRDFTRKKPGRKPKHPAEHNG